MSPLVADGGPGNNGGRYETTQTRTWGLGTDGQRVLAKLGSTVFALPPA
ncbi:hypothetical protein KV557_24940 [Kitasatospora aureofaciens]|nr:hypothetical protein [Kitasatospora aureofaciens]MBV6700313.1 hypothetical protein [Kitasatospora aureofaciens]